MALESGSRIAGYEITSLLGTGGMGEVYRARDPRLERDVALKLLPATFAQDADRVARFRREARTLAALNHPRIAQIYGLEDAGTSLALVMELVEGEDLAQRLVRGALPVEDALAIARQIADALDAAHTAGIVHRDLKPANITVTPDGVVKVLDFGLAKAIETEPGTGDPGSVMANSPTITTPAMTQAGMILGTAAYMSPEQARGKKVDKRTDIWAFGCVIYELLTGRRAFDGETVTDVLSAIIRAEPDWSRLPANTPGRVRQLLERCLQKDPRQRLRDIGDIGDSWQLEPAGGPPASPTPTRVRTWAGWAFGAIAVAVAVAAIGWARGSAPSDGAAVARFVVDPPAGHFFSGGLAVSPNGRRLVARVARTGQPPQLWVRELDSLEGRILAGTAAATSPFWSPDSGAIGFFQSGRIRVLELAGGETSRIVTELANSTQVGATWGTSGTILFATDRVYRVAAAGGAPAPITRLDEARGDVRHASPSFLPDGNRFVYVAINRDERKSGIYLGALDSDESVLIESNAFVAAYLDGYLLFGRDSSVFGYRFDPRGSRPEGDAIPIANAVFQGEGVSRFFLGVGGRMLSYVQSTAAGFATARLEWVSRSGSVIGAFGDPISIHSFWLSFDEAHAVIERPSFLVGPGGADVWVINGQRGTTSRLTSDPLTEGHPVASPDGRLVGYFSGTPTVSSQLLIRELSGLTPPTIAAGGTNYKQFTDWSADGSRLVVEARSEKTGWDLQMIEATGQHAVTPLVQTQFDERMGQLSSDGRLLAYTSNETGRVEVYVVNVPALSEKVQISSSGGTAPRWRQDGRELFFVDSDGTLMRVPVATQPSFKAGTATALFDLQSIPSDGWTYAVARDGQRFLVARPSGEMAPTRLIVVLNWAEAFNRPPGAGR